jgi:cell division transport system permease protein
MSRRSDLTSIGLTKIWAEGQGVDRASKRALSAHIIRRAWENVRRSPVTATLTTVTISIALFLFGLFILLIQNTGSAVSDHSSKVSVALFLADQNSSDVSERVKEDISAFLVAHKVTDATVTALSKADALARFREVLGSEKDLLEGVDADNPLPASVEIELSDPSSAEPLHAELTAAFGKDPRIESVRYSRGAVDQLRKVVRVVQLGGGLGIVFLLVITGFIIANTIKLALYSHRIEVEIMHLVGATRNAIFAPYLIEGGAQGVVGSLISIAGVFLIYLFIGDSVRSAELLQYLFPSFSFLGLGYIVLIVGTGAVVGMVGSFFAVRRFITEE